MIDFELIKKLPKTDVHVHLDGSIRLPTLIELAREYHVQLPSYTEEGLKETVFKDSYSSLVDYLQGFGYTIKVMQSEVGLERVAYELALDNQAEGVRYVEVRFAPQFHVHEHLSVENVLRAVNRGLPVESSDGHKVGEIHEVLLSEPDWRLSGIVITRGFVLKHPMRVPADWVAKIGRDRIRLNRSRQQFEDWERQLGK